MPQLPTLAFIALFGSVVCKSGPSKSFELEPWRAKYMFRYVGPIQGQDSTVDYTTTSSLLPLVRNISEVCHEFQLVSLYKRGMGQVYPTYQFPDTDVCGPLQARLLQILSPFEQVKDFDQLAHWAGNRSEKSSGLDLHTVSRLQSMEPARIRHLVPHVLQAYRDRVSLYSAQLDATGRQVELLLRGKAGLPGPLARQAYAALQGKAASACKKLKMESYLGVYRLPATFTYHKLVFNIRLRAPVQRRGFLGQVYELLDFPVLEYSPGHWLRLSTERPFVVEYESGAAESVSSEVLRARFSWEGGRFSAKWSESLAVAPFHYDCASLLFVGEEQEALSRCSLKTAGKATQLTYLGKGHYAVYVTDSALITNSSFGHNIKRPHLVTVPAQGVAYLNGAALTYNEDTQTVIWNSLLRDESIAKIDGVKELQELAQAGQLGEMPLSLSEAKLRHGLVVWQYRFRVIALLGLGLGCACFCWSLCKSFKSYMSK